MAGYEGVEVALMLDLTCGERLRATRDQGQVSVNRGFLRRQNRSYSFTTQDIFYTV